MRTMMAVAVLVGLVACSSADEGESCQIVGTYTMTGETESGDCPPASGGTGSVALTISEADTGYALEIQGIQGACPMTKVSACKLQGKCEIAATDAIDPQNNVATIQYTWTFDSAGFTGFSAGTYPPITSIPAGCSQNAKNTGTRR